MRIRWVIILGFALGLMILAVGTAYADAGPHGGFNATTSSCASCHRAHTAIGDNLLKTATVFDLCVACHNGSSTSLGVMDGLEYSQGAEVGSLRAGGFLNAKMQENPDPATQTPPVLAPTTSRHAVIGMTDLYTKLPYTSDVVWGIGAISATANPGTPFALECTTCHDPHGKGSSTGTATYRILRGNIAQQVAGASGPVDVPDVTTKDYTIHDSAGRLYYGQQYPAASDTDPDNGKIATLSNWCATCHTRIHAGDFKSSGDAIYNFRHQSNGTSVEYNFGTAVKTPTGAPACLTCHVVHGTSVSPGERRALTVPKPGTAEGGGTYLDSSLLRIKGRGTCEACHNK